MNESRRAMASWLGSLSKSGVVRRPHALAGEALAAFVVGEEALTELRGWLSSQSAEIATRERRTAIEVCIWMAHADRVVHPEERNMLRELVAQSELDSAVRNELIDALQQPPSLEGLEERLTHPILRELLLALAWELAQADDRIDEAEQEGYLELVRRLGISDERAEEIQRAMNESV